VSISEYEKFFEFSALYKRIQAKKGVRLQTPPPVTDFPMNEIGVISVQARKTTESLLAYPDGRAFAVIVVHERIRQRT